LKAKPFTSGQFLSGEAKSIVHASLMGALYKLYTSLSTASVDNWKAARALRFSAATRAQCDECLLAEGEAAV
jgi:hypothetical protein